MHRRTSLAALCAPILLVPLVLVAAPAEASTVVPQVGTAVAPSTPTITEVAAGTPEVVDAQPVAGAVTSTVTADRAEGFSMVGVTWDGTEPAGTQLTVRTRDGSGAWSEPVALPVAEEQAPGQERRGTDAVWTGPAVHAEVAVTSPDGTVPQGLVVNLVDPTASTSRVVPQNRPSSAAATETTTAAPTTGTRPTSVPAPAISSRAAWGADEGIRGGSPEYQSSVKALVIHHTAGSNTYSCSDVPAIMRGLYAYDVRTLGWDDIAYNFTIDKCGGIWESAAGGVTTSVASTHAGGFNSATQGVALLGNYETVAPSAAMITSLVNLLAWKAGQFGIDPSGTTTLTQRGGSGTTARWSDGYTATLPTIFGHTRIGNTACPGKYVIPMIPSITSRVAAVVVTPPQALYTATGTPGTVTGPLAFGDAGDVPLLCDWDGDGVDTMSIFRRGTWYYRNSNGSGSTALTFAYGNTTDAPLCGDWDGDGKDSPGVYRDGVALLRNTASSGRADGSFGFGDRGDTALVGDWDGDGYDTLAVARPSGVAKSYYLTNSNLAPRAAATLSFGNATDVPLTGDWNGDGYTTLGVFRTGQIYLTNDNIRPSATVSYRFGNGDDQPLPGDVGSGRTSSVSIARGY